MLPSNQNLQLLHLLEKNNDEAVLLTVPLS